MALFKRRLRSVKDGWNEMAAVVMEMQETLEAWSARLAIALTRKQDTLTAGDGIAIENGVISAVGTGGGYEVILDQVCTASKLNLVFDEPMRDVMMVLTMTKDTVRGSSSNVVNITQGSTIVGRISIASGTVTAATQSCILRAYCEDGFFRHWYVNPAVSGTTANYSAYTTYWMAPLDGGITKIASTQNMPVGARLMIYGVPMGEG